MAVTVTKRTHKEFFMDIPKLSVSDILELRKPHPCGDKRVKILRLGSDVRIECLGCGRQMTLERIKLERAIRRILSADHQERNG